MALRIAVFIAPALYLLRSAVATCCGNCGNMSFCSPNSSKCYGSKQKHYYETCVVQVAHAPRLVQMAQAPTLKVMSYNTEYSNYNARMGGYGAKIAEVAPAVVGTQECQNRDGLASASGLTDNKYANPPHGNFIFYDPKKVTLLSGGELRIPRDNHAERFITWGEFKVNNAKFMFFDNHLPHNHNEAASQSTHARIAKMLLAKRKELGAENAPTIVVGDMNSFASNWNKDPAGGFESNLQANGFTLAYTAQGNAGGHGGIDHILYSTAHWMHSGCRDTGTGGSDHTSITCDLTLKNVGSPPSGDTSSDEAGKAGNGDDNAEAGHQITLIGSSSHRVVSIWSMLILLICIGGLLSK